MSPVFQSDSKTPIHYYTYSPPKYLPNTAIQPSERKCLGRPPHPHKGGLGPITKTLAFSWPACSARSQDCRWLRKRPLSTLLQDKDWGMTSRYARSGQRPHPCHSTTPECRGEIWRRIAERATFSTLHFIHGSTRIVHCVVTSGLAWGLVLLEEMGEGWCGEWERCSEIATENGS
jgi:hypothetical protein